MKGRIGVIVLGLFLFTPNAKALNVYSVRAGEFKTEAEAQALQQELGSRMSPVFVEERPGTSAKPWAVLVGHFPYQVEAWVFSKKLAAGLPGCEVVSWIWDGRQLEINDLPVELPFDPGILLSELPPDADCPLYYEATRTPPPEAQEALEAQSLEELTDQELLYRGEWAPPEEAFPSLERLLEIDPDSPLINRARIRLAQLCLKGDQLQRAWDLLDDVSRLGDTMERSKAKVMGAYYVRYEKGKRSPETFEAFRETASDPVLQPEHRLDAMLRTASLAQSGDDYCTAWLAYSQLEKAVENPKLVAFARVHKAALAFELVSGGKSSWAEARLLCQAAESVPNAPPQILSTARLMWAETFFQERNYERALKEMERLVQDFPDVYRERATARYWKARCLQELGRYDEAIAAYSALEQEPVTEAEMFAALHPKAKGLLEKAKLLMRQNRNAEAQDVLDELIERYPNSKEARSVPLLQD